VYVNTFDTGIVAEQKISAAVQELFDLTPRGIIRELSLLKPIYRLTAAYGHFGRDAGSDGSFSWERTDKAEALKAAVK
jgi:S-adenosylmethionine synthetase